MSRRKDSCNGNDVIALIVKLVLGTAAIAGLIYAGIKIFEKIKCCKCDDCECELDCLNDEDCECDCECECCDIEDKEEEEAEETEEQ